MAACRVLRVGFLLLATACSDSSNVRRIAKAFQRGAVRPDEIPKLVTSELPFRYPPDMYARRAQGNVTLRLFVDRDGAVRRDSTRVEESSGFPALDSAAVRGSMELRFVPAKVRGEPKGITVLFPVYFRHPDARALPGDTILNTQRPAH
jgi:protein TonB